MFVGHYSAAFAAKRFAPAVPLPVYFIACQLIDIFWGSLVLQPARQPPDQRGYGASGTTIVSFCGGVRATFMIIDMFVK
jgi:hypothetical protein